MCDSFLKIRRVKVTITINAITPEILVTSLGIQRKFVILRENY